MGWKFRNAPIDPLAHFCMLLCTSESPGISRNPLCIYIIYIYYCIILHAIWIHDRWRRWRQMLWNTWVWERGTLPGAMLGCRAAKQHPSNINSSWLHAAANIPKIFFWRVMVTVMVATGAIMACLSLCPCLAHSKTQDMKLMSVPQCVNYGWHRL